MIVQPTVVREPERTQVFLSHRTDDKPITDWVKAQVEAMGIRCWVAEDDPKPGTTLSQKVREAIAGSVAMIVLLTEAAYDSPYVQQEIGVALGAGLPVFALVDDALRGSTMAMLEGTEVIYFQRDDLVSSSANLIAGLHHVARRTGNPADVVSLGTQPALQVRLDVQIQLTPGQLFIGMLLLGAVVLAIIYLSRNSD
jgi:hypothetical protein